MNMRDTLADTGTNPAHEGGGGEEGRLCGQAILPRESGEPSLEREVGSWPIHSAPCSLLPRARQEGAVYRGGVASAER
jgi:hypothetical protein